MSRRAIVRLFAGAGLAALGLWTAGGSQPQRLLLFAQVRESGTWHASYDLGRGYERGAPPLAVEASDTVQALRFAIPAGVARVRIRLPEGSGPTELLRLCVRSGREERCFGRAELPQRLHPVRDAELPQLRPGAVVIIPTGENPQLEFELAPLVPRRWPRLAALVPLVMLVLLPEAVLLWAKRLRHGLVSVAGRVAERRYAAAAVLFALLVALELHGASVAMWDDYLSEKTAEYRRAVFLGSPRLIRSDEWAIQTPLTLGQRFVRGAFFPLVNPNIRSDGQNMLIHHVAPVWQLTLIARPFHWGYLLLGNDHGLAWWWWSRLLLLWLLSYEMAVLLSGIKGPLALLTGAWIAFAPAVQWGFSLCHTDLLIAFQALIVCAWAYTRSLSFRRRAAFGAGFFLGALFFVLTLYPPLQVALGYLALALLVPIVVQSRVWQRLERRDYVVLAALLAFAAFVAILFLRQSLSELRLLSETVFPGQRRASGGDAPFFGLQRWLMSWLLPFVYPPFSNPSELAGFMNLLPVVLLTLPWTLRRERSRLPLVSALLAFAAVSLAWLVVPFPGWLARLTLLDRVPTFRMQVAFELVGLYLTLWALGLVMRERLVPARIAVMVALAVGLLHAAAVLLSPMADFLGRGWLLAATLGFFLLMNLAFMLGRLPPFALALTVYVVVSGLSVNPLARGLSPIYDKVVTRQVQAVAARDPGQLWAARGPGLYANLLIATGVRTLNGSHVYPDLSLWRRLDPDRRYEHIYNRHAVVALEVITGSTEFELTEEPAAVSLRTSLGQLAAVGVKYLLSVAALDPRDGAGLRTLYHNAADDIFIYEISGPS